jgi:4-hydroxy-2-oxoglutarate aldolase
MLLEGMHLPLTTPFFGDGRLNLRKLEQNIARYSLTPAAGMVVLGLTGEADLLNDDETVRVFRTALESASPTKVMTAGISRNSVRGALDLAEKAASAGYDAVLLTPPALPGLTLIERRTFLATVADKSPVSIILSGDIPGYLLAELAFHPRVIGFLGSFPRTDDLRELITKTAAVKRIATVTQVFSAVTGRMSSSQPSALIPISGLSAAPATPKVSVKTRTKEVSFQILAADTESVLTSLQAGAVGAVPSFAAAAPQATYEVMAAWKDGDPALAAEKQQRLIEAIHLIEGKLGVAGLKHGCDLNGYFGGAPRLPRLPVTGSEKAEIERLMQGLKS